MAPSLRKRLFQVGSFALAGGLLYLALRGVDFAQVGRDLARASWAWLVPLAVITLASHWLRAWRWTLFLDALPAETAPDRPVSVRGAFGALMIGYMVNYAAPRLGEVVRTANVSSRYGVRFSAALGTVVVERVFDVAVLALAFLTVPLVFAGRLTPLRELLLEPAALWADRLPLGILSLVAAAVAVAGFLVYRRLVLADDGRPSGRVRRALGAFGDGVRGILRTPHRGVLAGTTLAMWACYALMAWLPFLLFGYEQSYGITLTDAWGIMLIGAIGVVLPSPGGVGTYHYITIQTLVLLFAMPQAEAATYALVAHAGQLVLYVTVGFASLVVQGGGLKALLRGGASEAASQPEPEP